MMERFIRYASEFQGVEVVEVPLQNGFLELMQTTESCCGPIIVLLLQSLAAGIPHSIIMSHDLHLSLVHLAGNSSHDT